MRLGTSLVYAVVMGILVCSLAVATQKIFFSETSSSDAAGESPRAARVRSNPPLASRPDSEAIDSLPGSEDETRVDLAHGAEYRLSQRQTASVAPSLSMRAESVAPGPPRPEGFDRLPEVPSSLALGGGGGGATLSPATVTTNSTGSSPAPLGANGGPQVREVFFGTDAASACQPGPRQFLLAEVDDLFICVVWSGLAGAYAERLTLLTPDGHHYQDLAVAFVTAGATLPADGIEVRGRQLPVTPAGWGANGETLVTAQLRVGGTFISQFNMVGLWTVTVSLDGDKVLAQDNFDLLAQ